MQKSIFMEKYPIYSIEFNKDEIFLKTTKEIVEYFVEKIQNHPVAVNIAVFDHYNHTKKLDGVINDEILDAQNVIFCFGAALPSSKILAARPRSIGVSELKDKFSIDFIEAPNEKLTEVMKEWVLDLKSK
nr:hypothetical protein [uncultured Sulfurimonas sp.]